MTANMYTLRDIRINKFKMSQRDFAAKFDINLDTLQNWEQGRTKTPDYVITMLSMCYYAINRV